MSNAVGRRRRLKVDVRVGGHRAPRSSFVSGLLAEHKTSLQTAFAASELDKPLLALRKEGG